METCRQATLGRFLLGKASSVIEAKGCQTCECCQSLGNTHKPRHSHAAQPRSNWGTLRIRLARVELQAHFSGNVKSTGLCSCSAAAQQARHPHSRLCGLRRRDPFVARKHRSPQLGPCHLSLGLLSSTSATYACSTMAQVSSDQQRQTNNCELAHCATRSGHLRSGNVAFLVTRPDEWVCPFLGDTMCVSPVISLKIPPKTVPSKGHPLGAGTKQFCCGC